MKTVFVTVFLVSLAYGGVCQIAPLTESCCGKCIEKDSVCLKKSKTLKEELQCQERRQKCVKKCYEKSK